MCVDSITSSLIAERGGKIHVAYEFLFICSDLCKDFTYIVDSVHTWQVISENTQNRLQSACNNPLYSA